MSNVALNSDGALPTGTSNFGKQTIGFVGGLSMLLNNILGPGIANFPGLFQQAGFMTPLAFILFCGVSSICGGELLVAAMRAMPGNRDLSQRTEFCDLCRYYLQRHLRIFMEIFFQLAMATTNISNIVQTSQVFDYIIDELWSNSCAIEFYPEAFRGFCDTNRDDISPFGTGKIVLSLGLGLVALFSLPLGYWNLDDNIVVQNIAMVFIAASIFMWLLVFWAHGLEEDRVPIVGVSQHNLGGTILFNFMFISTIPSWVCEKKPDVSCFHVISLTIVLASIIFAFVGVMGGMAFPIFWQTDNTILSKLSHIQHMGIGWRLSASLAVDFYAVASNLASIPIFSIMMRYNLIQGGILSPRLATAVAVFLPWICSVLLYTGNGFKDVVNFAGTFTSSIVNLMAPPLLYISSQRMVQREEAELSSRCVEVTQVENSATRLEDASHEESIASRRFRAQSRRSWTELALPGYGIDQMGRKARRAWNCIAWFNLIVMCVFFVYATYDSTFGS